MADKITNREGFTAVINGNITEAVKEWAQENLDKLDARNDKRKNTMSKTQKENEGTMTEILKVLADDAAVASEIGTILGISTQKASALCRLLVSEGKVEAKEIKVKNKGSVKQYSLVVNKTEETEETETEE